VEKGRYTTQELRNKDAYREAEKGRHKELREEDTDRGMGKGSTNRGGVR
jgi:hypothetical protein